MANNIYSRLLSRRQSSKWALDYEKCTTKELRKFLGERADRPLNEEQLQKVRDHGSYPLIDRLRQMDKEMQFPRFMELAPELRLGVYEALLVAAQATHKREGLHPAILRTSKQVYSEAMPILYKKNKFRARVLYFEQPAWSTPSGLKLVCTLAIEGSGGKPSFHHRMHTGYVAILRSLFEHPSTMHMLRMLTRLNIDFDLTTSQKQRELKRYSFMACDTMKGLCLSLSGNSKLKELSIVAKLGDQDSSDADLADILWPLLLLRDDIAVEFKGVTTDPANMSTTEAERTTEIDAAFCSQIALVKQLCIAELERPGWDGRCWAFHGIRDAEKALHAFKAPGKKLLCLNDIVNKSPVWKGLRREIERAEASGLGQ